MNPQTERSVEELGRLKKILKQNYHPALDRAMAALLRSAETAQVQQQRIDMLEQRAREQVSA